MKRFLKILFTVLAILVLIAGVCVGWFFHGFMKVENIQFDPQLKIALGGGGNSIVLTSEDGSKALVVDTKMGGAAKKLRAGISAKEIIVVNTHFHSDHIGGNKLYPGAKLIAGAYSREQWAANSAKERYPDETVAAGEEKILNIGSETVVVRNMGRAHTWDDLVVYLVNRKILVTGDIVFLSRHPVLRTQSGTSVAAWVAVLDSLSSHYEVKALVPGHGPVSDKQALVSMRDYFITASEAAADTGKVALFREKCKDYASLPGLSSMDKTLEFIRQEQGGKK